MFAVMVAMLLIYAPNLFQHGLHKGVMDLHTDTFDTHQSNVELQARTLISIELRVSVWGGPGSVYILLAVRVFQQDVFNAHRNGTCLADISIVDAQGQPI